MSAIDVKLTYETAAVDASGGRQSGTFIHVISEPRKLAMRTSEVVVVSWQCSVSC